MTVSTNVNTQPFSGDGAVTSFSVTDFKILSSEHVRLYLYDGTTTTLLTKDVDWSIVLNGDQETSPGGSVTYPLSGSPLPVGQSLVALRYVPLVQGADLYNQGGALAEVVEDALDRLTMISQQTAEVNNRTIKLDVADPRTADEFRDALFSVEVNSAASATAAATAQGLAETAQGLAETAQAAAETAQAAAEAAAANADVTQAELDAVAAAKADKVSGATNGNLAALDASGNLTDSGSAPGDFAPLASPAFTGSPTATTPAAGDNSTKLATTEYADRAVSNDRVSVVTNVTASRVNNTTYTNSTGKTLHVWAQCTSNAVQSIQLYAYVNDVEVRRQVAYANGPSYVTSLGFVVPAGATYRINYANGSGITRWVEGY